MPAILPQQFVEIRGWIKIVVVQEVLAQPRNVVESESPVKEARDGGLVGGVEYRSGGATPDAPPRIPVSMRKGIEIGRLEVE
ncbi:MAG: hypothetical protein Ct9H300mP1_18450 [Planctomycetaceae bacterium]|nr:MAG: hypothetical protein Ct9H300mP1_18450 [Planctomycetaceae bacterium]